HTPWARATRSPGVPRDSLGCQDAVMAPGSYNLTTQPCTSVTDTPAPGSPQLSGTSVTFTATSTGCPNPLYQFWLRAPGANWQILQPYSAASTFTWNSTGLTLGHYLYTAW